MTREQELALIQELFKDIQIIANKNKYKGLHLQFGTTRSLVVRARINSRT